LAGFHPADAAALGREVLDNVFPVTRTRRDPVRTNAAAIADVVSR
jgi:hypothetical protein